MCLTKCLPLREVPTGGVGWKWVRSLGEGEYGSEWPFFGKADDAKGTVGKPFSTSEGEKTFPGTTYRPGQPYHVFHNRVAYTNFGRSPDSVPYHAGVHLWKTPYSNSEIHPFLYLNPIAHDDFIIVAETVVMLNSLEDAPAYLFSLTCPWS